MDDFKETVSENIDKSGAKRTLRTWAIGALLLIAATFFLGSWVENKIDTTTYEHDARIVAIVEKTDPTAVADVVASLRMTTDSAETERGKEILKSYSYTGSEERFGVRTVFTVFMIVVLLFRSLRLTQTVKKVFSHRKKQEKSRENEEMIYVRDAVSDISLTVKEPMERAIEVRDTILDGEMSKKQYIKYKDKLIKCINAVDDIVGSFMNYAQIEERLGNVKAERHSMADLIDTLAKTETESTRKKEIRIVAGGDRHGTFSSDMSFICEATSMLVNTCAKKAKDGTAVYLNVRRDGDRTVIICRCEEKNIAKRWWKVVSRFLKEDSLFNAGISGDLFSADAIATRLGGAVSAVDEGEYIITVPDSE